MQHTGQRPFSCPYPECLKTFTQQATLRVHMKVHTGEKPHVCPTCDRCFATSGDLTKHIRTHTQERPYKERFRTFPLVEKYQTIYIYIIISECTHLNSTIL